MPLSLTQLLIFEIGQRCNLGHCHPKCPNTHPERYALLDTSRELDDQTIDDCIAAAYDRHGFAGLVGWHYYNEPTLSMDRILALMDRARRRTGKARFILWSNGVLPQSEAVLERFSAVHVTDYRHDSTGVQLDDRLQDRPPPGDAPCLRVFTEFILDHFGNHHPCCFDWRGRASLGNVFCRGFDALVEDWAKMQAAVGGRHMTDYSPAGCLDCGWRTKLLTTFDLGSAKRAEQWRNISDKPGIPRSP